MSGETYTITSGTGIPGRDFGEREIVTANALRAWLENARWVNLEWAGWGGVARFVVTYNDTPPSEEVGLGALWFRPIHQRLMVLTSFGWCPFACPGAVYTRRFSARFTEKVADCGRLKGLNTGYGSGYSSGNFPIENAGLAAVVGPHIPLDDFYTGTTASGTQCNVLLLGEGLGFVNSSYINLYLGQRFNHMSGDLYQSSRDHEQPDDLLAIARTAVVRTLQAHVDTTYYAYSGYARVAIAFPGAVGKFWSGSTSTKFTESVPP